MPNRLDASYIDIDGKKKVPVMLHRAILGSFERFIGILIENYAGKFPTWLSPVQCIVMGITDRNNETCEEIRTKLLKSGYRVETDIRNEKIGFKVREHTLQKIPYLIVIGDKEEKLNQVSVRTREGKDLGNMSLKDFELLIAKSISQKGI